MDSAAMEAGKQAQKPRCRVDEAQGPGRPPLFVNSQGQTFAVIEGPVEFRMGSPPTDTERFAGNEPPRRMAIPRRFAIAAKEVSVEQFQRFLKLGGITIDHYRL